MSKADNSVRPTTGTGTGSGFQLPGWIGTTIGAAGTFLASCQGNCWTAFPPFSGNQELRRQCLAACAMPTIPTAPGAGGVNTAGVANIATVAILGFVAYQILKR